MKFFPGSHHHHCRYSRLRLGIGRHALYQLAINLDLSDRVAFSHLCQLCFQRKSKSILSNRQDTNSPDECFLQERITGMRVVQIFNAEAQEAQKFRTINREYTQANLDSILYYAVFFRWWKSLQRLPWGS